MIPSTDVRETVSFMKDVFQFEEVVNAVDYVILVKDELTIHILSAGPGIGEMEFYLEVDDIETLWKAIESKLSDIKHKGPFDREYGMREIHLEVPATNTLMFVGQLRRRPES